jgi:hypothetical protein
LNKNIVSYITVYYSRANAEAQLVSRTAPTQAAMFRVARADAEHQICLKLQRKLDEFLELENYDWMLGEPQGHASSHITDLLAFLKSTLQAFTNLPVSYILHLFLWQIFNIMINRKPTVFHTAI